MIKTIGLLLLSAVCLYAQAKETIPNLELTALWEIDGPEHLQPSGLSLCQDKLLMVSDRHSDTVFELSLLGTAAKAEPFLHIAPPAPSQHLPLDSFWQRLKNRLVKATLPPRFDWEGITCDQHNHLYLLSEAYLDVLKIDEGSTEWLKAPLLATGRQAHLFQKENALGEGISWRAPNEFIVVAEREPRGLIRLTESPQAGWLGHSSQLPASPFTKHPERSFDISGSVIHQGTLYTLERNHFMVCERSLDTFAVNACWSYEHIERDPKYRYLNSYYGVAEGIAIKNQSLFIVLDNNEEGRVINAENNKPLLLEFELPYPQNG